MTPQDLWQLQNAMITAASNLTERVTVADWPRWIGHLLEQLDTYCCLEGYDADDMLAAIRDIIDDRLSAGQW
jgi:hypothetical protein